MRVAIVKENQIEVTGRNLVVTPNGAGVTIHEVTGEGGVAPVKPTGAKRGPKPKSESAGTEQPSKGIEFP